MNVVVTVLFCIEAVLRILSRGLVCHEGAYLRDPWDCVDFCVCITSIITSLSTARYISPLKPLRVLRVLRLITLFPALRETVQGLIRSFVAIANVLLLGVIVFD